MKLIAVAALTLFAAAPALAQTTPTPTPAPGATTATPPATAPAGAAKFTVDTPIEQLVADEKAKAVLTSVLGGDITQNPFYDQIKAMSFAQVQPLSQGQITDELMKKLADGLAAIK
ncbi:MAG: hypothetical protein H2054_00360 [Sphingomonas sp.]|uniref:hypothetical protein n=1 Tax=Sphingomonas sp. TaxID=28214 RepID=UPI0017BB3DBC|nr:hypothetical protein [Zymomonas sp.]MBA4771541.1 hypothetical protein [Sphingomonas sp.]